MPQGSNMARIREAYRQKMIDMRDARRAELDAVRAEAAAAGEPGGMLLRVYEKNLADLEKAVQDLAPRTPPEPDA